MIRTLVFRDGVLVAEEVRDEDGLVIEVVRHGETPADPASVEEA